MFQVIERLTADEVWRSAAELMQGAERATVQPSRNGLMLELLHVGMTIRDPRQRWISSRTPALNPAFAIAEVIWIMCGRDDAALLNYFNRSLPRFQGKGDRYHGAYGFRLRRKFAIDQLARAYSVLRCKPESRQVVLQIWDSESDLPDDLGNPANEDIPCNIVAMLKLRDGRLEWTQIMRSNDLYRGLPHNVIQFTCLQEIVAGWLGASLGSYHHFSDSLHFYESDGMLSHRLGDSKVPLNSDSLALPKEESDKVFLQLSDFADFVANGEETAKRVLQRLVMLDVPQPFRNLAAILAAEGCRRRQAPEDMNFALRMCGSSALEYMYSRWLGRFEKRSEATAKLVPG